MGNYDYAFLFKPNLPFMEKTKRAAPFFGLNDRMPVFLALLLGFQHSLSMLAGIITPPLIIAGQGGASLGADDTQYLVSTALIVSGLLSCVQITRFHIYRSPYYIGTGLISVVGTSFSIIPVTTGAFSQMYRTGYCPTGADGTKLPCPRGYGALLATASLCSLLEIGLSFTKPAVLKRVFPPLVTGPTVALLPPFSSMFSDGACQGDTHRYFLDSNRLSGLGWGFRNARLHHPTHLRSLHSLPNGWSTPRPSLGQRRIHRPRLLRLHHHYPM